jgi:hypothetical protein
MFTNRKLFVVVVGAVTVLAVTAFGLVERVTLPKPKADWNVDHWLRLLSGSNQTQHKPMVLQTDQPNQPSGAPAEIIGRVGYPLYH